MSAPLADRIRPTELSQVVGQEHLLGKGKILSRLLDGNVLPNMIFYGPSGVGKTTVANILASKTNKTLYKLNGTSASTADIKDIIAQLDTFTGRSGVLLYLDEIQYLNKKQQQSLLEYIENGSITLIASTTENPYFYIYNAILSRCTVLEFKPVSKEDIIKAVQRALSFLGEENKLSITADKDALQAFANGCGGDVRKAMNALELAFLLAPERDKSRVITAQQALEVSQRSSMRYDRDGDEHYDILSAFQKSIRGSDENAALHYMARLLEAGDLISICRRLLVICSEDIGLAFSGALPIVKAAVDSAVQLGLPEARIPLAQAVILLCTSPKSNTAICAIDAAMEEVRASKGREIPTHLKDAHYSGAAKMGRGMTYRYPHDYPDNYIQQQYLPDDIKDSVYYRFGENKMEQTAKEYRKKIREKTDK